MSIVRLFQERLDISRRNAIWRVFGFFSLSVCLVAIWTFSIIFVASRHQSLWMWILVPVSAISFILVYFICRTQGRKVTGYQGFGNYVKVWI